MAATPNLSPAAANAARAAGAIICQPTQDAGILRQAMEQLHYLTPSQWQTIYNQPVFTDAQRQALTDANTATTHASNNIAAVGAAQAEAYVRKEAFATLPDAAITQLASFIKDQAANGTGAWPLSPQQRDEVKKDGAAYQNPYLRDSMKNSIPAVITAHQLLNDHTLDQFVAKSGLPQATKDTCKAR